MDRDYRRGKPDPNEPWRYVCPECKKQVHRDKDKLDYRCQNCASTFEKGELHDKKTGGLIQTNDEIN